MDWRSHHSWVRDLSGHLRWVCASSELRVDGRSDSRRAHTGSSLPGPALRKSRTFGTRHAAGQRASRLCGKKGEVMGAYYNEFDPFAAQWLRNLIARPAQVQPAGSASDPAGHGTSGRAPRPFPATDSSQRSATPRAVRAQACGQHPELGLPRMIHTHEERLGSCVGIGLGCSLVAASPSFAADRRLRRSVAVRGTFAPRVHWMRGDIQQSRAICCAARGQQGKASHRYGTDVPPLDLAGRSSCAISLCISPSSNADGHGSRIGQFRTQRIQSLFHFTTAEPL